MIQYNTIQNSGISTKNKSMHQATAEQIGKTNSATKISGDRVTTT